MRGAVVVRGGNGRDMVAWRPCIWRFAAGYRRAGDFTWSARNRRGGQRAQGNGRDMKAWRRSGQQYRRRYRRSERSERSRGRKRRRNIFIAELYKCVYRG